MGPSGVSSTQGKKKSLTTSLDPNPRASPEDAFANAVVLFEELKWYIGNAISDSVRGKQIKSDF